MLARHDHMGTDAVDDTGHHRETFSEVYVVPRDMWIESLSFELNNAPDITLHHAMLLNLSEKPYECKKIMGRELWSMGQDQMHMHTATFPYPYRLFVKRGDKLILQLSVHNPAPPLGPGDVYTNVSGTLKLKTRTSLFKNDFQPLAFRLLFLADEPCQTKPAPFAFSVPKQTEHHVIQAPADTKSGGKITFEKPTRILYMGGHLHGWQGGVSVSVKKNGALIQTYETHPSKTVPYRYDTPHGLTSIDLAAGDSLSIESVTKNPHDYAVRGLMAIVGFYYTK